MVQLAFRRLRAQETRCGAVPLHSVQPGRNCRLLPPIHRAPGHPGYKGPSRRRKRLFQPQRRQPLAPCHRVARQNRHRGSERGIAIPVRRRQRPARERGRLRDRGQFRPAAGIIQPAAERSRSCRGAADRSGGRRRCLPAGRHRRHAEFESGVRDLGIHTEMLTDGIIDLYKAGTITGSAKTIDRGKMVFSFALGSQQLYRTIDRNEDFLCCSIEYTNLPHMIMRNERFMAINNTTQMDLQGQASSESSGHRHISGTGGQLQFVRGAYASKDGKSFVCLSSTYERHGIRKSRIVLDLTPGNVVTTPRSDMMYVVTEFGMVNLKGKSVPERAKAMISLAHPDFREELARDAREHGLIPRALRDFPRAP